MLTISSEKYRQNGVLVYSEADKVKVIYDGLLAQNGAANVYAHVGFGKNWTKTSDHKMRKTRKGFETSLPAPDDAILNVAFKDCADHWDNNSGQNYNFVVTP